MKPVYKKTLSLLVPLVVGSLLVLSAQEAKQDPALTGASKSEKKGSKWGVAPSAEFAPQRVMLGWTGDPAHTQAVTWRTAKPAATPQVQFAPSSAGKAKPLSWSTRM